MNQDGTFFLTDQEGFWLPKNRINWVKPGSFHGNMWGYHNVTGHLRCGDGAAGVLDHQQFRPLAG